MATIRLVGEIDAHLLVGVRLSERTGKALRGRNVEDSVHPDDRRAIGLHLRKSEAKRS